MDRTRLTITLKKSILKNVDEIIDGTNIRNRSHAIETLISQSLSPNLKTCLILAGGRGVKMQPFTFEMPKGLFPVGGKPILLHLLELLKKYNVRNLIFSIGHLGEKIEEFFGNGQKFGVNITYVKEDKSVGTGGALLLAKKYLSDESFMVIHGDILIEININDLLTFHKESAALATIAVTSVIDPSQYGEIILNGSKITRFTEKPEKGMQKSQLISSGFYVVNREIFSYLPKTEIIQLEDLFPKLAQMKLLSGYPFAGRFFDIGTPQSYALAINNWGKAK